MRRAYSAVLSLAAIVIVFLLIEPATAGEAKRNKEKAETSSAITAEQLDAALAPISAHIEVLQQENAKLHSRLSDMATDQPSDEELGRTVQTLRISLVLMGLGVIGGLWKLRSLARRIENQK